MFKFFSDNNLNEQYIRMDVDFRNNNYTNHS